MFGNITTINSNFSAMEALYNLKKTNGQMSFHQTRLSTGKRINSAEDDAAAGVILAAVMPCGVSAGSWLSTF